MENFLTWEVVGTFAGCLAATAILTELMKKLLPKLDSQLVSFVLAMAIIVMGDVATRQFIWEGLLLDVINAAAVSLSANGGYDLVHRIFGGDGISGSLIVTETGEKNPEVYIQVSENPKDFKDGDKKAFVVQRTNLS